eukprot:5445027-Prymnesium_polylepis.1
MPTTRQHARRLPAHGAHLLGGRCVHHAVGRELLLLARLRQRPRRHWREPLVVRAPGSRQAVGVDFALEQLRPQ